MEKSSTVVAADGRTASSPSSSSTLAGGQQQRSSSLGLDVFYKLLRLSSTTGNQDAAAAGQQQPGQPSSGQESANVPNKRSVDLPELVLTKSQRNDLVSTGGGSIESRLRVFDDIVANARSYQIAENTFSFIFHSTTDLLSDRNLSAEFRHRVWRCYTQLVDGHAESLGQIRFYLFDLVHNYQPSDDELPVMIDFLEGWFSLPFPTTLT